MRAYITEGYFHFYINEPKELPSLEEKPIEANLQENFYDSNLEKKVTLRYDKTSDKPLIGLFPKQSSWKELKEINVTITKDIYDKLKAEKKCVCKSEEGYIIDLFLMTDKILPYTYPEEEV